MTGPRIDADLVQKAIGTPRWNILARTGLDVATIATWDRLLPRRKRICVPVDVQAYVVPATGGEPVVAVCGDSRDPAPFATGASLPRGVHVHWALPDALLRGEPTTPDARGQSTGLVLSPLPDRWVVIRLLRPRGLARPLVRGWVIDPRQKAVEPLDTFNGTFNTVNAADVFTRLDAAIGGSLMWTASYTAAAGRFGFHDPLDDVPPPTAAAPSGLNDTSAAYVVAGWWTGMDADPLGANAGLLALGRKLESLGWLLDDDALQAVMNDDRARRDRMNKSIGLSSPDEGLTIEYTPDTGGSVTKKIHGVMTGVASPVSTAASVTLGEPQPEFATLLHGAVLGVPLDGAVNSADDRPAASAVTVALGQDVDDVVSAFGASVLGAGDAARDAAERLMAAYTSDMLDRIATADGIADLAEHEHADGFDSRPGPAIPGQHVDRFIATDANAASPFAVGRKGRGVAATSSDTMPAAKSSRAPAAALKWRDSVEMVNKGERLRVPRTGTRPADITAGRDMPPVRTVTRPAPREFFPQAPMLALRGVKPNLRHHFDDRFESGGQKGLRCRYAAECVTELSGALRAADILVSLGSGAIPEEVLPVVREAILLDPYGAQWLQAIASAGASADYGKAVKVRLQGEMVRLYGTTATYSNASPITEKASRAPADPWLAVSATKKRIDTELVAELAAHSIVKGTPPSPVAITTWRQPWVPLWVEWRVVLSGTQSLEGWQLGQLDYERTGTLPAATVTRTLTGRTPLGTGVAEALHAGIKRWLEAEVQRDDAQQQGVLDDDDQKALARLGDFLEPLDMASASMDGVREQMLGIAYMGQVPLDSTNGVAAKAVASAPPVPFFGGTMTLDAMRVVDAFGRTLDLDVSAVTTTRALEVPAAPAAILLRPRFTHVARWVVRFVGAPDTTTGVRPDAFVDQVTPAAMVNPVAGFLLPDHIDESLEVFATDGTPIGELSHDPITGAVTWEPAPGRPVPPDAGPFTGLEDAQAPIANVAAGVLLADVSARGRATPPTTTSLAAMLRAIDTTLWTVDTYATIGSPTVAGLVGRPVAVVRATLRLDAPDDTGEVTVTHAGGAAARAAIFAAVREMQFPFRLGALDRSDDSLLGFFIGDDFTHLHLVDQVVRTFATASGRMQGALGQLGADIDTTPVQIDHPYIVPEDELRVRPGEEIALTLLMLPAGKVHLTTGITPRKALALAEDWVAGLKAISPSVRVGPVLVDPSEIRLPLIRAMGPRQRFTRRTGPLTWRDDPITAATMTAYLPRMPHEAQEGWIRVNPEEETPPPAPAAGGTP